MINKIRIQNFKSIKDVELNLQQVNLFIGPNNSGKSNFLKGIKHLVDATLSRTRLFIGELTFGRKGNEVKITLNENDVYSQTSWNNFEAASSNLRLKNNYGIIGGIQIYSPQPEKFKVRSKLDSSSTLNDDAGNLVSYLFNLKELPDESFFNNIESGLAECIQEFKQVKFPTVFSNPNGIIEKQIQFVDENKNPYMADEVSDGVLYFLALLCIVNQPNPPKLLILEEPEKGIHPRRIKEVLDYIFHLAEKKNIQVIISSHSVNVVDYFSDLPESVFIFDKINGETKVKNLLTDIINPQNEKLKTQNLPEIKFTESLSEHWAMGFLGGVPE
jgi:predicted ATPase